MTQVISDSGPPSRDVHARQACSAQGEGRGADVQYETTSSIPLPVASYSLTRYVLASTESPLATIDGWPINIRNLGHAVDAIMGAVRRGEGFSVCTLNLDHLAKLRTSAAFRSAYARARFVTADGEPVARLAARQHGGIVRTTGADLVVPLAQAAAREGIPVYLFGTAPEVLARAGRDLCERCEGTLDIAGSASPSQAFDPQGPEADAALDRIVASGAKLCLVALGAPKQEIFSARAVERGIKVGFVSIGAALDFIAGSQVRAPAVLQRHGLEWAWRLASSPRRLAKRYALSAVVLADIILLGPIRHSLAGPYR